MNLEELKEIENQHHIEINKAYEDYGQQFVGKYFRKMQTYGCGEDKNGELIYFWINSADKRLLSGIKFGSSTIYRYATLTNTFDRSGWQEITRDLFITDIRDFIAPFHLDELFGWELK